MVALNQPIRSVQAQPAAANTECEQHLTLLVYRLTNLTESGVARHFVVSSVALINFLLADNSAGKHANLRQTFLYPLVFPSATHVTNAIIVQPRASATSRFESLLKDAESVL